MFAEVKTNTLKNIIMYEAIINEKTTQLRSLTTKQDYILILTKIMLGLWNIHSVESFNIICRELDFEISKLKK